MCAGRVLGVLTLTLTLTLALTLAALLGEKDESVRENERTRLTRAAFSALAPSATPRSSRSTCVSAAAITCVRGAERSGGGASGPGAAAGREGTSSSC